MIPCPSSGIPSIGPSSWAGMDSDLALISERPDLESLAHPVSKGRSRRRYAMKRFIY